MCLAHCHSIICIVSPLQLSKKLSTGFFWENKVLHFTAPTMSNTTRNITANFYQHSCILIFVINCAALNWDLLKELLERIILISSNSDIWWMVKYFVYISLYYTFLRLWRSDDCTSWYILTIKPTKCTNFSNLFWIKTLHVSDSSCVCRHPDPARKLVSKPVQHVPFAVRTVQNSWWWTEELSETCRVLFQK